MKAIHLINAFAWAANAVVWAGYAHVWTMAALSALACLGAVLLARYEP